jgi:hypothetical protein
MEKLETWHLVGGGSTILAWAMWRSGQTELLWLLNAVLTLAVMWSCVCRFAVMDRVGTAWDWRERYVLIFITAACSFMSPWLLNERPGFIQVMTWLALLRLIEINADGWRKGVPDYAKSDYGDLRDT